MELVNALLIAANMLFGGSPVAPNNGSGVTVSQQTQVVVIDTLEVN